MHPFFFQPFIYLSMYPLLRPPIHPNHPGTQDTQDLILQTHKNYKEKKEMETA